MNHKSTLTKLLKHLGFAFVTPSIAAVSVGDIYHVIELRYDRRQLGICVDVGVWHPKLDMGVVRYRPNLFVPLSAGVTPVGTVASGWPWNNEEFDLLQIERVIRLFFYGFRSLDDMLNALKENSDWEAIAERLRAPSSSLPFNTKLGCATYDVQGGASSKPTSRDRMASIWPRLVSEFGFVLSDRDPDVYLRRRGEVWDCVHMGVDNWGTIATVSIFHWIPELWLAEPLFEGRYIPFNGQYLDDSDGRTTLLSTLQSIDDARMSELKARLELVLGHWSSKVIDVGSYLASLGSEEGATRRKLESYLGHR